ncbi:MAG: SDR family NAD(P)-dependent oxidoreductase, partial [Myxococcota bacterium]
DRTAEGWEFQFATNHLGHFLFTGLLVPALVRGAPSRVVNLSSAGHRMSPVVFDDIHYEDRPYDKWESYGQSKTANILFSVALNARLAARGVSAYAVHPGMIMTELGRHMSQKDLEDLMSRRPADTKMEWKSVEAGAATSVWAATATELEGQGGRYLEDCGVARAKQADEDVAGYAGYAVDADLAERLWRVSEETLGEEFDFKAL